MRREKWRAITSARCECACRSSGASGEKSFGVGETQIALGNARFEEESAILKKTAHPIAPNSVVRGEAQSATARRGAVRARLHLGARPRREVRLRRRRLKSSSTEAESRGRARCGRVFKSLRICGQMTENGRKEAEKEQKKAEKATEQRESERSRKVLVISADIQPHSAHF